MALSFPLNPAVDDTYTYGDRTWRFNGIGWVITNSTSVPVEGAVSVASADFHSAIDALDDAVSVVSNALSKETSARIVADVSINNAISVINAAVVSGNSRDQTISVAVASVEAHVNAVSAAVASTYNRLSQEMYDRGSASSVIEAHINAVSVAQSVVQGSLSVENAARISADSALSARINSVATTGGGGGTATTSSQNTSANVVSIKNTLNNAVSVLSQRLSVETAARQSEDTALSARITSTLNTISVTSANLTSVKNSLQSNYNTVYDSLSSEIATRAQASINLESHINTVSNAASAISQRLSVETAGRITQDDALSIRVDVVSNALSAEVSNRISADDALSLRIDSISQEVSVTSADLVSVRSHINNLSAHVDVVSQLVSVEIAARLSEDQRLSARVDLLLNLGGVSVIHMSDRLSVLQYGVDIVSNALSNEISNRISAIDRLSNALSVEIVDRNSAIDKETSNRISAIDRLSNALSVEIVDRNSAIDKETSNRISAIDRLSNALSVEVVDRNSAIAAELSDRISADNALSVRIDGISNQVSVTSADLVSAKANLLSNINVVSNALSNEISNRISAINSEISNRTSAVAAELSNRVSADNALSVRIDGISNQVSVTSADLVSAKANLLSNINVVSNALSNEISNRISAINSEISNRTSAVAAELSNRVSADNALSVRVDFVSNALSVVSAQLVSVDGKLSNAISALSNSVSVIYAPKFSPTFTGTIVAPNANSMAIGTPTLGALAGAVTMATSTSLTDGLAQLNQVLNKLVPGQPSAFPNAVALTISGPTQRIMFTAAGSQTNNDATNITTAAAGTIVYVSRATTYSTNTITTTGPGDSGTITVYRNTVAGGSHEMTVGNTTANVVYYTVTNTTNSSAVVTVSTPSSGVLAAGHVVQASASFGGLVSGNYYYVTNVLGSAVTLDNYNYTTGVRTTAFSGTTASGGTITLTEKPDVGTYTTNNNSLILTNNIAYPATTAQRGFWETMDVAASGTGVVAGWNSVQIRHSGAGNTTFGANTTNQGVWYYDNSSTVAPSFASQTFALGSSSTINSSTIPHYTSSTVYNIGFTVTWNAGQTGHPSTASTILTGAAAGAFGSPASKTYANLAYTTLPSTTTVTAGAGPNSTTYTTNIISGFGAQTTTSQVPSYTADNSYTTTTTALPNLGSVILYKTGTTGSTSFLEETNIYFNTTLGSGSGLAFRVTNPDGGTATDNPAFTAGAAAFSTLQATDATVVGTGTGTHALKYNTTNYSTGYLPVGPDLSSRGAGAQYFTFKFVRTGVSKFNITYATSTGVAGIFCAMPGQTNLATGHINSWLSLAIDNANSGGCALGGNFVPANTGTQSINCSFGSLSSSSATGNEIWIRIKLTAGQAITALYIGASTV